MSNLVYVEFLIRNGIYSQGDRAAVPPDFADRLIAAGVARIVEPATAAKV